MTSVICYKGTIATDSKIVLKCAKKSSENICYGTKLRYGPGFVLAFSTELPTDIQMDRLKKEIPGMLIALLNGKEIPYETLQSTLSGYLGFGFVGMYSITIDDVNYQGGFFDDATPIPVLKLTSLDQLIALGSGEEYLNYAIHAGFEVPKAMELTILNDYLSGGEINMETIDNLLPYVYVTHPQKI
jgi:hypothetical protein